MAAAMFSKNALRKAQRHHLLLHNLRQRSTKHTIPNPPAASPKRITDHFAHQFQQSKWSFHIPSSILRKSKELEVSPKLGLISWYMGLVKTRPVATKSITSAVIYTAADLSSQTIMVETSEGYDLVRTLRMGGYGMLIIGPSLHYWFNLVSRVFPKRDFLSTLKKMVLGQTVYGPIVTTIFFAANAALQGESYSEIIARLKRDLLPTMMSGIMYWPVCDFMTFKFFPVHLQPLVSNSFSYLWSIYVTYMASLEKVSAN